MRLARAGPFLPLVRPRRPLPGSAPPPSLARVFGLKALVAYGNCSSHNALAVDTSHDWPVYVSPGLLLLLYYTVTSLLKLRARPPRGQASRPGPHLLGSSPLRAARGRRGLSSALVSAEEGGGRGRRAGGGADPGGSVAPGPGRARGHQGGGACPGKEPALSQPGLAPEPACPWARLTGSRLASAARAAHDHGV